MYEILFFTVNGVVIKHPTTFKIERYNITTLERLANADMVGDFVAQKLKFYFTYEAIGARDMNDILEAIWDSAQDKLFFELQYPYQGEQRTSTVYVGSIPSELHYGGQYIDSWVWKNVTFNLIQR